MYQVFYSLVLAREMKVLAIGNSHFVAPLRALGHDVMHAHYTSNADVHLAHPTECAHLLDGLARQGFVPDLLLYTDNGNLPLLLDPEVVPCPSIWFSIDTYCNPWHMAWAHGFDASLVAQKDFVHLFADEGLQAEWFPLFCAGIEAPIPFAERDIPVAFVGTLGHRNNPGREPFLRAFRAQHPLIMLSGEYKPVFLRSRIVLNQTAFAELNFRCFEGMACGAALLMEQCNNGLLDIFTPDVDILPPYPRGDAAAAAGIAARYLARPEHLAEIAVRGYERVGQKHSASARTQHILALAAHLREAGVQEKRLRNRDACRRFVRTSFGIIASDMQDPNMGPWRSYYARVAQG